MLLDRPPQSYHSHLRVGFHGQGKRWTKFCRWKMGLRRDFRGFFNFFNLLTINARSRLTFTFHSTAPPLMCWCCTVVHYDGGLRFSSISPGCNEFGGGRVLLSVSGVFQEFGPVAPITPIEGSSRGGPGCPRPAGSYWEFSSREINLVIVIRRDNDNYILKDQPFVLLPELSSHQAWLSHHHHVLKHF